MKPDVLTFVVIDISVHESCIKYKNESWLKKYAVESNSFRPDIQKPRQMENSAIYGLVNVSVEKCFEIKGDSSPSLVFSPKAGYGRNQSPVRRPVWLWHTAF